MFSNHTPFLFPHASVRALKHMREEETWTELVERIAALPETDAESLAFQLMMVGICGCMRCTSYKANLGCTTCSQRAVRNEKSSISEVMSSFTKATSAVNEFMINHTIISIDEIELAA